MAKTQRMPTKKRKFVPIPPQFGGAIERLRQATIDATEFSVPWSLFHDELAVAPGFNMAGVRDKNQRLRLVIEKCVEHVDPDCRCGSAMLLRMGDFWHGLFETSLGGVVAYYFEREDLGLLGFVERPGSNHLARFSVVELAAPVLPGAPARGRA